jgi:hypothetical protein
MEQLCLSGTGQGEMNQWPKAVMKIRSAAQAKL